MYYWNYYYFGCWLITSFKLRCVYYFFTILAALYIVSNFDKITCKLRVRSVRRSFPYWLFMAVDFKCDAHSCCSFRFVSGVVEPCRAALSVCVCLPGVLGVCCIDGDSGGAATMAATATAMACRTFNTNCCCMWLVSLSARGCMCVSALEWEIWSAHSRPWMFRRHRAVRRR